MSATLHPAPRPTPVSALQRDIDASYADLCRQERTLDRVQSARRRRLVQRQVDIAAERYERLMDEFNRMECVF